MVVTQLIEIFNFPKDRGVLTLRLGPSRSITNYNNLIHIVNLEDYENNIQQITNTLNLFEKKATYTNSIHVTKLKLKELTNKFATLYPMKRNKRGLINGLGSTIKFITGNMDAQDAQTINEQIQYLNSNLTNITNTFLSQNAINSQTIERFKNITSHINNQQNKIEEFLSKTYNAVKREDHVFLETQYLNEINFNIDLLTNHISNIAEAVILSKLNIIPKFLLNTEELYYIENKFVKQNVKIESNEQIYEFLGLQAYYNGSKIIFNVRIPNLSNEKYFFYHVVPLPINQTKFLTIEPYININEKKIQHFTKPCPKIEGVFYCTNTHHEEDTNNSECMGKLMRNEAANCPFTDKGKTSEILQPEKNYILIFNTPKLLINSTCSTKTSVLEGTALIHFQNCSIEINGLTYEDNPDTFWDEIHIPPPPSSLIKATVVKEDLNLEKLKEYNFITNSNFAKFYGKTEVLHLISASTALYSILTIIIIIIAIIILRRKTHRNENQQPTLMSFAPSPITSLWPSLYSKGGGVTCATKLPPHRNC